MLYASILRLKQRIICIKGGAFRLSKHKKKQLLQCDIVESTLKIPPVGLDKV